jgi:hypothetical protein
MGQYYKFVNATKQAESHIPLPFNFRLSWAKSLEYESQKKLKEMFDYVIANNNWAATDEVIAIGDYGTIIYYPKE